MAPSSYKRREWMGWPAKCHREYTRNRTECLAPCGKPYGTRRGNKKPCALPHSRLRCAPKAGSKVWAGLGWIHDRTSCTRTVYSNVQAWFTFCANQYTSTYPSPYRANRDLDSVASCPRTKEATRDAASLENNDRQPRRTSRSRPRAAKSESNSWARRRRPQPRRPCASARWWTRRRRSASCLV